jgi:hypothetical protein
MKCLQCNSSQVEKRSAGMWCAECRDYVQVFHEPAAPKSGSTYRFAKPPEAAAPVDSQSTTADPAAVPDFPLTPPGGSANLIPCHMCGHQVSPEAFSCSACGQPLQAGSEMSTMKVLRIIFWVIIGLVVGYIILKALFISIADAYIHS